MEEREKESSVLEVIDVPDLEKELLLLKFRDEEKFFFSEQIPWKKLRQIEVLLNQKYKISLEPWDAQKGSGRRIENFEIDEINDTCIFVLGDFQKEQHFDVLTAKSERVYETKLPTKPLYSSAMKTLVVCCTGIHQSERSLVARLVEYMEGEFSPSFTTTVTHVIAGDTKTQKYRTARKMNKPIVTVKWIHACWAHQRVFSTQGFSVPVFLGCTICVTGFYLDLRDEIQRNVVEGGAVYSPHLDREECTHLIAAASVGRKYTAAASWGIPIVNIGWLYDSVKDGSCLPEENYTDLPSELPTGSAPGRTPVSSGRTSRNEKLPLIENKSNTEDEVSAVDVEVSESVLEYPGGDGIFDGIRCYFCSVGTSLIQKMLKILIIGGGTRFLEFSGRITHVVVGDDFEDDLRGLLTRHNHTPTVVHASWLINSAQRKQLLPLEDYEVDVTAVLEGRKEGAVKSSADRLFKDVDALSLQVSNVFSCLRISSHDAREEGSIVISQEVEASVNRGGGEFVELGSGSTLEDVDFIVLEHGIEHFLSLCKLLARECDDKGEKENLEKMRHKLVTTYWIGSCLVTSSLLDIEKNILFRPFVINLPIKDFDSFIISITNFTSHEREELKFIIDLLGGVLTPDLRARNTQLVCKTGEGRKFEFALAKGIPVVEVGWLYECIRTGNIANHGTYEVKPVARSIIEQSINEEASVMEASYISSHEKYGRGTEDVGGILYGTVFALSAKLHRERSIELSEIIQAIGGQISEAIVDATHLVYQSRNVNENSAEVAAARSLDVLVVSPQYIFSCQKEGRRLLEEQFPHTYNTRMNLSFQKAPVSRQDLIKPIASKVEERPMDYSQLNALKRDLSPHQSSLFERGRNIDQKGTNQMKRSFERYSNGELDSIEPRKKETQSPKDRDGGGMKDTEADIDEIMTQLRKKGTGEKILMRISNEKASPDTQGGNAPGFSENVRTEVSERATATDARAMSQSQGLLKYNIEEAGEEKRLLLTQVMEESKPKQEYKEDEAEKKMTRIHRASSRGSSKRQVKRTFQFSSGTALQKERLVRMIQQIGGKVVESSTLDASTTHLIAIKPTRSLKMMSAIVKGVWILRPEYIEACVAAGGVIPEERFELVSGGQPIEKSIQKLVQAASYWRKRLEESNQGGAFSAERFFLSMERARREQISKLLIVGGAQIVTSILSRKQRATCALFDVGFNRNDYDKCLEEGIPMYNVTYITEFILNHENTNLEEHSARRLVENTEAKTRQNK